MRSKCHQCGEKKRLGIHWVQSSCDYPEYTPKQREWIQGMMMGDGYLRNKAKARNPYFVVAMMNKRFLQWVEDCFGVRTNGLSLKSTSDQVSERAEKSGFGNGEEGVYHDIYQVRFRSHPIFLEFIDWYDEGKKRLPSCLELTPEKVKMWYVCDGGIKQCDYPTIEIYSKNELDRISIWVEKFQSLGFDAVAAPEGIKILHGDSEEFLDWLGSPPPGFEYKWELDDRERYDSLKAEVYDK
jgi:hypothetical protein